ncbi:MAG: class I SAM-dependent methyltransferase [Deltaproteobacteria bacterium]|nr:class I SAM-dependent methyltransferase [Deltaproteobacteria bacterium]MBW2696376.1 class I SAM-dependent methyltransferase [Deltaproteobacteria bacterium]
MRTLTYAEAQQVYDRIGAGQDSQAFYEDRATDRLLAHADFGSAHAVFEFGFGTGRFAETLLRDHLPPDATYRGVDLSPVMVELAAGRLAAYGERASVAQSHGGAPIRLEAETAQSCDRFVANFVLDLLSEPDVVAVLDEAGRILRPGGRLCVASLSPGHGPVSGAVIGLWSLLHRINPKLVGGCRPLSLPDFLPQASWRILERDALSPFGLPLEAIVAQRRPEDDGLG